MGIFVANKVVKLLIQKGHKVSGAKALILGIAFKENCPDIRNTKVVDIYHELKQFSMEVDIYDPWADPGEVKHEYGLEIMQQLKKDAVYDAIILAVAHNEFLQLDYQKLKADKGVIFDTKAILSREITNSRL